MALLLAADCSSSGSGSGLSSGAASGSGASAPPPSGSGAPTSSDGRPPSPSGAPAPWTTKPAVAPVGTSSDETLTTPDGRRRTFHVYVPTSLRGQTASAATKVPLLVALHGGFGWGHQFERNSGFDGVAEANGFVVVYPDGIGVGANADSIRTWNGGACCGPSVKQGVDDVGFVRLLLDDLEQRYPIDPARVVAAGHSNGGIMAFRLACQLADRIVAIGVQSSSLELGSCHPSQPVSVLQIHGTADKNIPFDGGRGQGAAGVSFNPPKDAASTLAAADDCEKTPTSTVDPKNDDLATTIWAGCRGGAEVQFLAVTGATHAWMGHTTGGSGQTGPPYLKLDSSQVIWTFLALHPRR